MSITWLSSKRFTQKCMYVFTLYRTSVIILTPFPLHPHIHSVVKLCRKGVLQTKREAGSYRCCSSSSDFRSQNNFRLCVYTVFDAPPTHHHLEIFIYILFFLLSFSKRISFFLFQKEFLLIQKPHCVHKCLYCHIVHLTSCNCRN